MGSKYTRLTLYLGTESKKYQILTLYMVQSNCPDDSKKVKQLYVAEVLKCMLSHTGDLDSRLDTLDDIDTEKKISPNCFIALKFISLVQLMLVHSMRTGVRQCLQVSERP